MVQEEQCYRVEQARELIADPRYIIDEFIGSGAMACVYKARERATPNVYALKLLREKYRQRPKFLEIFEREAIHMRDLQYPNIVRFYKFVIEDNSAYILMDFVEGKPLTHFIQEARNNSSFMDIPKIVRIMAQIARAIAYLHAEGYIHRDIKPGNVLLAGEDESAFLTDLGIAGGFSAQDALGGAGTPSYMPYEQQTGGEVNLTADVYAFAIMLFEMFTGRKPFIPEKGLSFQEARESIIDLHQSAEIPSVLAYRPELPEKLDEYFAQALAKNPAERYHNIIDFVQDVHESLLPFLTDDLKDFEAIKAQEIKRSASPEIVEVPATQPQSVLVGGISLIILITVLVLGGLYYNNIIASPTATSISIETSPLTAATNAMLSNNPVVSPSNSTISEIPSNSDTATPFMANESQHIFATGAEAIGTGFGDLNQTIRTVFSEQQPFVFLRIWGDLNSFYVQMLLDENSLQTYQSYGIAFHIRNQENYQRFRVDVANSRWLLESIEGSETRILLEANLEALQSNLLASSINDRYRFELDGQIIPFISNEWDNGATALYFEIENPENINMTGLSIGVIGEAADYVLRETPTYIPPIEATSFLLRDVRNLQASGDATGIVQCPQFVSIYDSLERHNQNNLLQTYVEQVQSLSAFIYSRCLVEDGAEDFNDSYSDYLAWEDGIERLIAEIENTN